MAFWVKKRFWVWNKGFASVVLFRFDMLLVSPACFVRFFVFSEHGASFPDFDGFDLM